MSEEANGVQGSEGGEGESPKKKTKANGVVKTEPVEEGGEGEGEEVFQ